jgi:CBS domain-containing protein
MIKESFISVAGLVGQEVIHKDRQEVGKLVDLVFRWDTEKEHPPLSGILVQIGRRVAWIGAAEILEVTTDTIRLRTAKLDLRDYKAREGEVRIVQDVLDHQLVDINGARVVRASDLYIAVVGDKGARLVGVDVSYASLLRRLGPRRWRKRPVMGAVIDWAAIQSFGQQSGSNNRLKLGAAQTELHRLRPSELADLLEDLGRTERQELLSTLSPEQAADALEEMQPEELEGILRESTPDDAAGYLANMEPDEAADALRDVDSELREDLLARMPGDSANQVEEVLAYEEESAGGFMTTAVVTALPTEKISSLRKRLLGEANHSEIDAVVITDAHNKLLHDLAIIDIFLAEPDQLLGELISLPAPITVSPNDMVEKVAELLIANRRSSVLVVNSNNEPVGRILADDVVDALLPQRGRFRFPRVLS